MTPEEIVVNLKHLGMGAAILAWVAYGIYLFRRAGLRAPALAAPMQVATAGGANTATATVTASNDPGETFGKVGSIFVWAATGFLAASIAVRWIVSGRAPYSNQYEFSVAFAFGTLLMYGLMEAKYPIKTLGVFVMPVALGLLAYSTTIPATIDPLIPALQNNLLLTAHVAMAIFAYGMFAVSFGSAVGYLIQGEGSRISWLPSGRILEEVGYRAVTIGFPLLAVVLVLGAIWGNTAWGRFWAWDPKETATLMTWLIYAAFLHTRAVVGWRGKRSAFLQIVGFGAVLFTFYGVNLFIGGLHSYSGL